MRKAPLTKNNCRITACPMPDYDDAPSWYARTATPHPDRPAFTGEATVDVCIVGGGYTGLSAALELAERGYSVILLEARRLGWGASGRNGGQVITGYNLPVGDIARLTGRDDAAALWRLNLEATDLLTRRIAKHKIDCDWRWGWLNAALKPRHLREAAAHVEELNRLGYPSAHLLDRAATQGVVDSPAYLGGLLDMGSGHLHPLNYALGLARAAEQAGARLYENSAVTGIEPGEPAAVRTENGTVRARFVLLGINAYGAGLTGAGGPDAWAMPVATYVMATEPLGEARAARLLPTDAAVADMNLALNYFRRSADHRLLFGGGVSYSGYEPPGLQARMRAAMLKVFPDLKDVRVDCLWGGQVAITVNRLPRVGRIAPNILYAHGYSGHGVALAGLCGKLMAEAVAGTAERFDVFARIPHRRFPLGAWSPARRAALTLGMLWARLRDLL
jgi:gamma-glutamylputrescine oxidase